MIKSYRELIVWQKASILALKVCRLTGSFPKEEIFGLTSQMRRAAISIPSNIAEGRSRNTRRDFVQFLRIALGSAAELQSQLDIAEKLSLVDKLTYNESDGLIVEIMRMLSTMISKLKASSL